MTVGADTARRVVVLSTWTREGADSLDRATGLAVWVRTGFETSDAEWADELTQLEASEVVVVVVSAEALADPGWEPLVAFALELGTPIVVVAADATPLGEWPRDLLDARPAIVDTADASWQDSLTAIIRRVDINGPRPDPPPPRPPRPPMATGRTFQVTGSGHAPTLGEVVMSAPATLDDDVQFTVYRPGSVAPDTWNLLLVFAHKSELDPVSGHDPLAEVRRQASAMLGEALDQYRTLVDESAAPLRRGSDVVVEPFLEGATFNPPTVSFRWEEPVHRADFRFRIASAAGERARGGVRVFVGAVVVGELSFSVRVGDAEPSEPSAVDHAKRFRKVFASYSHDDTEVVLAVADVAKVLGVDYVIDVRDLRSGDDWAQQIEHMIEQADTFQLFWSSNALRSTYVLQECRHALSLGRDGFIQPVYWEDPLPEDPAHELPLPAIRRLHFSRLAAPTTSGAVGLLAPPSAGGQSALPPPRLPGAGAVATTSAVAPLEPAPPVAPPGSPPPASVGGAAPPPPPTPLAKRSKRPWAAAAAAAVVLAAGIAAVPALRSGGDNSAAPVPSTTASGGVPTSTGGVPTSPGRSCSWENGYRNPPAAERRRIVAAQPALVDLTDRLLGEARAEAVTSPGDPVVDLTGQWAGSNGLTYAFRQFDDQFVVQEISGLGITAVGRGQLAGRQGAFDGVTFDNTSRDGALAIVSEGRLTAVLTDAGCGIRVQVALRR